jgi:hypothetical protein
LLRLRHWWLLIRSLFTSGIGVNGWNQDQRSGISDQVWVGDQRIQRSVQFSGTIQRMRSVNDTVAFGLPFEVGNVEVADGVDGGDDDGVAFGVAARGMKLAAHLPQCPQDAGAVESLSFTVFAEAHLHIILQD